STLLIDTVLNKTQRKTNTVIKRHAKISRIRKFYTNKVKFIAKEFGDRLSQILEDFPQLDDIHLFYRDLINILYDRDTYKMCLGHVAAVRKVVEATGAEYVRLIKYGESLFQCKQLKRAAFGKMASAVRKLNLDYLEEVRQHMSRLPKIQMTRTLMLVGYPNVGKSSYMQQITRAKVDVQPYP
ncbi:Nucleolar GTP-binding protein 1, partial [Dictyocoela roeselum]